MNRNRLNDPGAPPDRHNRASPTCFGALYFGWIARPPRNYEAKSLSQDRRRFNRISVQPYETEIKSDQGRFSVYVIEESIDGLAMIVPASNPLRRSDIVEVGHGDDSRSARIQYVAREDNGQLRVGAKWSHDVDEDHEENKHDLLASFVRYRDLHVVCSVSDVSSGQVDVALWNGARFRVAPHKVVTRSFDERRDELSEETVAILAKLYQPDLQDNSVQAILDFEFV